MPRSWIVPLFLALAPLACGPEAPPRPSALLLTIDTTVPEALGAYGGPRGLTPNLDRLAATGVVFEDARAVTPLTLPSHASILTGLVPVRHSVRRNGETRLPGEAHTLAERARAAGYRTAAFVAAVVLAPEFGLDQGFERYDAPATPESVEEHLAASRTADQIADAGLAWLGAHEDEPFFLWLHFYDPHFPYRPPAAFLERAGGDPYLGEVAAMDAAIGRVLDRLEESGRLDSTLVVVVADHGEGRGRHGEDTHGAFVFDSTIRIPMLARLPGGARAGERVTHPVSQVDLAPLVASALELPEDATLDGRDPFAPDAGRGAYFESYFGTRAFGWSPAAGWADATGKLVHSSAPEFYDLTVDPGETRNLLAERADEVERARERIRELCGRPRLASETPPDELASLQRQIERLGYAGVGSEGDDDPEPLDAGSRPSPHAMVAAYDDYMEGRRIHEEGGPPAEAAVRLERAVAANPGNHKAWFTLGLVQQRLERFERAVECFRRVLPHPGGERIPARLNLAVCLYNLGRRPEAIAQLEDALEDTVGPPGALELLVKMLEEEGRTAEAAAAAARSRATARGSP